jgi:hypothetical protein
VLIFTRKHEHDLQFLSIHDHDSDRDAEAAAVFASIPGYALRQLSFRSRRSIGVEQHDELVGRMVFPHGRRNF